MKSLDVKQTALLESLGLTNDFSNATDDELVEIEDRVCDELMLRGIDETGDGVNDYGALCESIIDALPE